MEKIRFGLIGASCIAQKSFIPAIKKTKNAVLTAVAARDKIKASAFAKQFNIPHFYHSYLELLSDQDVDAVYISLPNHLHADIHYSGLLEFSNGRLAHFAGGFESSQTCEAIIVGEKGTIILNNFLRSDLPLNIILNKNSKPTLIPVKTRNHYVQEIEDMADTINGKKHLFISKQITINHQKVLEACLESARKKSPIEMKPSFYI